MRKIRRARELRRRPTEAERAAWEILRNRRLLGLKFRRQHPLYGFIADFYCPALQVVLEIDGGIHTNPAQAEYDCHRTTILESHGLTVIRVKNEDVNERRLSQLLRPFPLSRFPGEGDRG